jgi:Flp pilus assembly protein protease CpaA
MLSLSLDFAILPFLLYFGVRTSLEDLRRQRIRNREIVTGVLVGAVWVVFVLLWRTHGPGGMLSEYTYGSYTTVYLVHIAMGWLIGFGLWRLDLWSAGDGKIFAVYCMLLTPGVFQRSLLGYFPGFTFMANAFLSVFCFIFAELLWNVVVTVIGKLRTGFSLEPVGTWLRANWFKLLKQAMTILVLLMFIIHSRGILRKEFGAILHVDPITIYILLFFLYEPLMGLNSRRWFFPLILSLLVLYLGYMVYYTETTPGYGYGDLISEIFYFSKIMIFILGFSLVYFTLSPVFNRRVLRPRQIKEGMVLHPRTIALIETEPNWGESFAPVVGNLRDVPLTDFHLEHLRQWYVNQPTKFDFSVEKYLPFAPGLFLGALLSYLFRGNVINISG